jgi:rhamnogalacturonan endolyase
MTDSIAITNQTMEQYWFLRDGETGTHVFTRVYYYNSSQPFLTPMDEFRTLFRLNTPLWTHYYSDENHYSHALSATELEVEPYAQDATWYVGNFTNKPYVDEYSDFFTKYGFSEHWRDHKLHVMWSDGTASGGGSTYGAWMVHNTVDTYFGGPLRYDLLVDGIVVSLPFLEIFYAGLTWN